MPPKSLSGHWRNSGFWRIGHHIRRTWTRSTSKPGTFFRQKPKLHLTQILPPYVCPRRGIRLESGGPDPQNIGFRWRTCQRRHLPRAFETARGPLGPLGHSLTENMPFGGFSAGLHCLNQLAAVVEILVFGGLAPIFAEFEFAGLLNRQRFAAKRPGYVSH